MENVPAGRRGSTEFVVACSFVCFWGLALSRFFDAMSMELLFALAGGALLLFVLACQSVVSAGNAPVSLVDAAIALIWVAEATTCITSSYRRNSFNALLDLSILTILYFLFRILTICRARSSQGLPLFVFALLGSAAALAQARTMSEWLNGAVRAGLTDITALKALCPTLITPRANDWATTLLLFVPFALLVSPAKARKPHHWILLAISIGCNAALIFSLLLVLSRGAFLGLATFWAVCAIAAILFRIDAKQLFVSFAAAFVIALVAVSISFPAMAGALKGLASGNQSVSQTRSVDGRIATWKSAWIIARNHAFLGIGANNFSLHNIAEPGSSPGQRIAGQTYNTPLQILIERGIIGVAAYSLLLVCLLWSECRFLAPSQGETDGYVALLCISAITALCMRELTYSSILSNPQSSLLMWLIIASIGARAITVSGMGGAHAAVGRRIVYATCILMVAGATAVCCRGYGYANASARAESAAQYLNKGRSAEALAWIASAIQHDPHNAYYLSIQGLAYGRLGLPLLRTSAMEAGQTPVSSEQMSSVSAAIYAYRRATEASPLDDNFINNLGWLYFYAGDRTRAEWCLRKAVAMNPWEAANHIGLGALLEIGQREDAASHEYAAALALSPGYIESSDFRFLAMKRPAQAQEVIAESISLLKRDVVQTRSPIAKAQLGALLLKSGYSREAIPYLREAVADLPNLPLAWKNLGGALKQAGSNQEADAALTKAVFLGTPAGRSGTWMGAMTFGHTSSYVGSGHASKVRFLYMSNTMVPDDLLPPGFLNVYTPARD